MLDDIVSSYIRRFPEERSGLATLIQQIIREDKLNNRRNFTGHITGSAIVLSPDKTKILLIHHKLFDRWQQPGGHWESDDEASPLEAAKREAEEETGVSLGAQLSIDPAIPFLPLMIDSHRVPARPEKDEPPHYHHDFSYAFVAQSVELHHQEAEVDAAAWFALDTPETMHVRATIEKLRQFQLIPT